MRLALAFLVLAATAVDADPAPPSPWAQGVSPEHQARANALVAEANQLFAEGAHPAALEKYTEALAEWDHPTVRLNMAVTLIRLDRYLEAGEALDAALRYGAAPFTPEKYQLALDYKRLVDRQIGTIDVSCRQAGVHVQLDGKSWLTCPGRRTQRVLAGEHAIVAEAPRFMTVSRQVVVASAATVEVPVALMPIESAVRLEYPTARWIPWTVGIAGAVIGVVGVPVWYTGRRQMDRFQQQYAIECAMRCEQDLSQHPALRDLYGSARFDAGAGATMMVAGGVAALGGIAWATLINRPHRVLPALEVRPTRGGGAATATWSF